MGAIRDCADAGIPWALLVSVLPHNAGWGNTKSGGNPNGKMPARFNYQTGQWGPSDAWLSGQSKDSLLVADDAFANCGVLAGQEVNGCCLLVIDADFIDDTEGWNVKAKYMTLRLLSEALGCPDLLIRHTVEPRFMILVKIKPGGDPGRKTVLTYSNPDSIAQKLGKIELLTVNQQFVAAGIHQSGSRIYWYRYNQPRIQYLAPPILHGLPEFDSLEQVRDLIIQAMKPFEKHHNIKLQVHIDKHVSDRTESRPPIELAPPDFDVWMKLIRETPNPDWVNRDKWVDFWRAFQGCRSSMIALGRLTPDQALQSVNAMLDWSQRWQYVPGDREARRRTREEERAKYTLDWEPSLTSRIGWDAMVGMATHFGLEGFISSMAADQFAEGTEPEPAPTGTAVAVVQQSAPPAEAEFIGNAYRSHGIANRHLISALLSDLSIADVIESLMGGNVLYLAEEQRWLTYDVKHGWRGDAAANGRVGVQIENYLYQYVGEFAKKAASQNETWSKAEINNVLSDSRIRSIRRRLQDRFSINWDDINLGKLILQTPGGAFDLTEYGDKPIDLDRQKALRDMRCTKVTPKAGPTPMFDLLLRNLAEGYPDTIEWLWNFLGYTLLGMPMAKKFLFICGTTNNGKSAIIRIMKEILGDYMVILNKDVFLARGKTQHSTSLYRIRNARFAAASEMPPNEFWNEELLKKLTGYDEIQAHQMFVDEKSFHAEAVLLLVGNDIPNFDRVDQALAERACIAHTTWKPAKVDKTFEPRLIAQEGPAILYKMIQYGRAVYQRGIELPTLPEPMQHQTRLFLTDQDTFYAWVDAELSTGYEVRDREVPIRLLRDRYDRFLKRKATEDGESDGLVADKVSNRSFLKSLRSIGAKLESLEGGHRFQRVIFDGTNKTTEYLVRGVALKVQAAPNPEPETEKKRASL